MTGEAFFLDVAKISITIAGFAGVIGALRYLLNVGWKLNEIAGLKLMLEHSFFAVVAGLLPSVLFLSFADEPTVWLWSSTLLALFLAYEVLINIVRLRHASAAGTPPRSFGLLLATFFVPTIVFLYFAVQNAISWRQPVAFAAGILWLIVAGCTQFMVFLLHVKPTEKV